MTTRPVVGLAGVVQMASYILVAEPQPLVGPEHQKGSSGEREIKIIRVLKFRTDWTDKQIEYFKIRTEATGKEGIRTAIPDPAIKPGALIKVRDRSHPTGPSIFFIDSYSEPFSCSFGTLSISRESEILNLIQNSKKKVEPH